MTERIAGIVLAAGVSSRMGEPKLLLPIAGQPIIRAIVKKIVAAGLDEIIVVVPDPDPGLCPALCDLPVAFVVNSTPGGPTSASLHLALRALSPAVTAAVVVLPDMPHVSSEMVRAVVASGRDASGPLTVSQYGNVFAPPLFFRRSLFPELLAWHGDGCGKQVVHRHREAATVLSWPAEALADIDTPEDFKRLLSEMEQLSPLARQGEPI